MRAARINRLAQLCQAKRYLEIGVCLGETFLDVTVSQRVGVDPVFRFDVAKHADKNTVFHQVTSDEFFRAYDGAPFDLIYIDGLHTFDQTTRDFFNSISIAHDATIWLIDDTVPNDVFSADPDQDRCYALRQKMGGDDWAWMGDVYKTIFLLERALPFFHFRTFGGHGQTVLWRERHPRALHADAVPLHAVGAMTYLDMLAHLETMRIETDEAIFAALADGARRRGRLSRK